MLIGWGSRGGALDREMQWLDRGLGFEGFFVHTVMIVDFLGMAEINRDLISVGYSHVVNITNTFIYITCIGE